MIEINQRLLDLFDRDFCEKAEYHLTRAWANLAGQQWGRIWCDGILEPDISIQTPSAEQCVITQAFIGFGGGMYKYWMVFHLGESVADCIANGLGLKRCLPDEATTDWITVDTETQVVELQLK